MEVIMGPTGCLILSLLFVGVAGSSAVEEAGGADAGLLDPASGSVRVIPIQRTPAQRGRKERERPATLQARWMGQGPQDWTGPSPAVGPDGLQDVRIHLNHLAVKVAIRTIRIEGTGGARWEFGPNPQ